MAGIRIRIGAALDSGVLNVFVPLEKRAQQAAKNIQKSLNTSMDGKQAVQKAKQTGDALDRELDRMANKIVRDQEKAERKRSQIVEREAKERIKSEQKVEKEIKVSTAKSLREQERAAAQAEKANERMWARRERAFDRSIAAERRANTRMATSVRRGIGISFGLGAAALGAGAGLAADVLGGMGLDLSLASHIGAATENQQRIQNVVNAGYIPGAKGSQGVLANTTDVQAEVYAAANKGAYGVNEVAEGLQKFVGLTGDLETGRNLLDRLAVLSRATGSNFQQMAMAAGEVSNNLGDVPDRAAAVEKVMRVIAGQGKLGAVEIRDLARQMAKIATQAGKFEGGGEKNIGELGIIAQEAKLRGGAATATQAATSVVSFASDITKNTTLKHWLAARTYDRKTKTMAGLSPFTDASHTTLRSPEELILEALKYSKGDLEKINQLFPNRQSVRAVQGFAQIYSQTKGTDEEKIRAVTEEFERLRQAQLTSEEVQRAYTAAVHTSESQVQIANNKLDMMAGKIRDAMMPALAGLVSAIEPLTPLLAQFAGGVANLINMVTGQEKKNAEEAAAAATGKLTPDQQLLLKSKGQQFVPGKGLVPTYSGQVLDVIRAHGTSRSAAIGALETQVADAEALAKISSHGLGSNSAKAQAERAEAQRLRDELTKLKGEQEQSNSLLSDIYTAIKEGNALRREAPAPGAPAPAGGTDSGESDSP